MTRCSKVWLPLIQRAALSAVFLCAAMTAAEALQLVTDLEAAYPNDPDAIPGGLRPSMLRRGNTCH